MDISKVTISCAKSDCPGGASVQQSHCGVCHNPVVKRYLRVLSPTTGSPLKPETLLEGRYWVTNSADIVLDTQPQERPFVTDQFPAEIASYLKLSPHMLHCPKVFGLTAENGAWLLEYPSMSLQPSGLPVHPALFASLLEVWKSAEPLQQLNWLAQIAGLMPDLAKEGAGGTLYDLSLLGINGGVVQIRQLLFDRKQGINFPKIGQVWRELLEHPHKSIQGFCSQLYKVLKQGRINQSQVLLETLNAGISELGRLHYEYRYDVYTQSDAGPARKHNEDACFPEAGIVHKNFPLAIVCDGIGGHDKGEVASAIAIETLQRNVAAIDKTQIATPSQRREMLSEFVLRANDAISDQNDQEQRKERARMGTTVVMSWAEKPYLYLTHVGDSRIYRVTTESCHQLTYDDDLGSREVRLGYALYQDALSYPSAGALVQALGMNPSQSLHPTVQQVVPDCDVVYLLCSDGLSDYNRVESHWQSEIVPLLKGHGDIQQLGERLIAIANSENGHDNSTIALVHMRLRRRENVAAITFPTLQEAVAVAAAPEDSSIAEPPVTEASEKPQQRQSTNWLLLLVGLLGLTGIGLLVWNMWRRSQINEPVINNPSVVEPIPISESPNNTPPIVIPGDQPTEEEPSLLTKNQIVRLQPGAPITAFYTPQAIAATDAPTIIIAGGSILRIEQINEENQVLLEVCKSSKTPASTTTTAKTLAVGNRAWIAPNILETKLDPDFVVDTEIVCGEAKPPQN
ncbi:MAG: protein phosphatase 2C domain-containing protein [Limnothrix sp.]